MLAIRFFVSESIFRYAGQTHAYQAYADASFVPLTGLPSEGTKQRSGGYSSSEYHEAVAGLPGFLESPRTTFLHDGPSSQADVRHLRHHFARCSRLHTTPHAPCDVLYVRVPMRGGC